MVAWKSGHTWLTRRDWLLDLAAGAALAVVISLILNRGMFGLSSGEIVQVFYGNF